MATTPSSKLYTNAPGNRPTGAPHPFLGVGKSGKTAGGTVATKKPGTSSDPWRPGAPQSVASGTVTTKGPPPATKLAPPDAAQSGRHTTAIKSMPVVNRMYPSAAKPAGKKV